MKYIKTLVCCPASVVTGGPELLHQLVEELRRIGHDAYIVYYPFNQVHQKPESYRCYDAPQSSLIDENNVLIVIPETATWIIRYIKNARVAVWWLSVDNYLNRKGESKIRDLFMYIIGFIRPHKFSKRRVPIWGIKRCIHLFQSQYARDFLACKGLDGVMLTDYLSDIYLNGALSIDISTKQNIICYNPKKGLKKTNRLRNAYPEFTFVPIQGLTRNGVYELLCRSKVYIDFGHHPGKDRLPREAAMAGCCVITGRQGSANNDLDVPLPQQFKLDDNNESYISEFGLLLQKIFSDFCWAHQEMAGYREKIMQERTVFKEQVKNFFGAICEVNPSFLVSQHIAQLPKNYL
ncbi:hypothetical protein [Thermochromatium tepidum]|uniref:Glycosyltransferase n=1 Tax=Thermochromatium tepidum ATCC 43061 TaxID=316276 RepID=A0A6I6EC72_THETI|nr:hypothetical protein [Thermochromatium tepidum]QGU31760.1 hypothetical protein E6P07_01370 [Thermochromatium tepidum ATCC 43061]